MTSKPSIRFPELIVYPDGKIFDFERGVFLSNYHGSNPRRGPVVYYYKNKKGHQLSRLVMVYETFIKKDILSKSEFLDVIDGDFNNTHVDNIVTRKKGSTTSKNEGYDNPACWMNGLDEIFL